MKFDHLIAARHQRHRAGHRVVIDEMLDSLRDLRNNGIVILSNAAFNQSNRTGKKGNQSSHRERISDMALQFTTSYVHDSLTLFHQYKRLAERAIEQVPDEQLTAALDSEMNSIAVLVKHMAGNMRSRWTDFLTTDGEKPDRNRDQEFEVAMGTTRKEALSTWEAGWKILFDTLTALKPEDVMRTVTIRGEPHTVLQALNRALAHMAQHTGQIVFLAKHFKSTQWKTLSVPRGESKEFEARMREKHGQA